MTWFAIRTKAGAQVPQREYAVETTTLDKDGRPRGKGYRIVPSLNANVSAIERALTNAGFIHYMPVEKRLIRDRRRTELWKARRFALLTGYVFIKGPCNFLKLQEVPGVAGIVGAAGVPQPIALTDILMLRTEEAKSEAEFDRQAINKQRAIAKRARNQGDKKLKALVKSLDIAGTTTVEIGAALLVA
jgi:transcription antitermination factor NusG